MGTVVMHNVVSVDGFIAGENDDVGPLHDWYSSGDTPITEARDQQYDHSGAGSRFKVSRVSAEHIVGLAGGGPMLSRTTSRGVVVAGHQ